jgi:regulator of ribonuclease activity A
VELRRAIDTAQPGEVLVVDGGGSVRCALFGGSMALQAQQRGIAGLIIYGAVRDVDELDTIDLGVVALGSSPVRSGKKGGGALDVAVDGGGVTWSRGDWAYADRDGVLKADQGFSELP